MKNCVYSIQRSSEVKSFSAERMTLRIGCKRKMAAKNEITTVLVSEEQFTNKANCVICFVRFSHNESVKKLQCSHMYHIDCIDTWLTTKRSCPICRFNVLPEEGNGNTAANTEVVRGEMLANVQRIEHLLHLSEELTASISTLREQAIHLLNGYTNNLTETEMTDRNGTQMRNNGNNQGGAIRRSDRLRQRSQAYSLEARTNATAVTRSSRITRSMSRRLDQNDQI